MNVTVLKHGAVAADVGKVKQKHLKIHKLRFDVVEKKRVS